MNVKDLKQIKDIILDSLKSFREDLKKDFATKDDLKYFATKKHLQQFPTKDDLRKELSKFATKDNLKSLEENINNKLENFATKKDLKLGLDDLLADIIEVVDKNKAEKSDVEALETRMDEVEKTVQIH